MTPNREYFIKYFAYVYEDIRGVLDQGAEWNSNVLDIPEEITLAKRIERWGWKELVGFGRDLNTINGLIIRINNLLKFDDYLTRDNHTVQGCINVMNDIINTFATLIPGEILIVDEYGRVSSSPFETDKWIDLQVNNDSIDHKITIAHEFNPVESTTGASDTNGEKDTIDLYTPKVDEMGHVVGSHIETVTLPYSYKTIVVENTEEPAAAAEVIAEAGQSADNTQDILTFKASNKWIKFDNSDEDTIQIGHELSSAEPNKQFGLAADTNVSDLDTDNTFEVPNFTLDEAGHVIAAETHIVTIPENFSKIKVQGSSIQDTDTTFMNGQIEADNLTDELTLASGNKWIVLRADENSDTIKVNIYICPNLQNIHQVCTLDRVI